MFVYELCDISLPYFKYVSKTLIERINVCTFETDSLTLPRPKPLLESQGQLIFVKKTLDPQACWKTFCELMRISEMWMPKTG